MEFTVDPVAIFGVVGTAAGAIVGAMTVYQRTTKPIRELLTKVQLMLADFQGSPARPGVRAVPGVMERLETSESDISEVKRELKFDGGGSLRDVVANLAAQVRVVSQHIGAPTLPPVKGELIPTAVLPSVPAEWGRPAPWPTNNAPEPPPQA